MNGPWTLVHAKLAINWREEILRYAGSFSEPTDRSHAAVTEAARPLLDWASEAGDKYDLEARILAMGRAYANADARWNATPKEHRKRQTPEAFLTEARTYHGVISGAAA